MMSYLHIKGFQPLNPSRSVITVTSMLSFDWQRLIVAMVEKNLTLTRILPLSDSGEGRSPDSSGLIDDRSNFSPKISTRYRAIFFCWGTLQWFSMDKITGYLKGESKIKHRYMLVALESMTGNKFSEKTSGIDR